MLSLYISTLLFVNIRLNLLLGNKIILLNQLNVKINLKRHKGHILSWSIKQSNDLPCSHINFTNLYSLSSYLQVSPYALQIFKRLLQIHLKPWITCCNVAKLVDVQLTILFNNQIIFKWLWNHDSRVEQVMSTVKSHIQFFVFILRFLWIQDLEPMWVGQGTKTLWIM